MNKRGQFFLMAALVIISLLLGLNQIYTEVNTYPKDESISFLIEETNQEFSTLLVASNISNYSLEQTNDAVLSLAQSFSIDNPDVNFFICYINHNTPYQIEANKTSPAAVVALSDSDSSSDVAIVDLASHGLGNKTFNIGLGENVYISLKKELTSGEVIADETTI